MGAVKAYLKQIRRLDNAINFLIRERDDLIVKRTGLRGISYNSDKVQTSPSGEDPNNRITEKIIDMTRKIDEEIDEYTDIKKKIVAQIIALNDARYSEILQRRYVDYQPFDQIADEMFYTYDTIRHYHQDALRMFGEKYAFDVKAFEKKMRKNTH